MTKASITQSPCSIPTGVDSFSHVTPDEIVEYVESISGELEKMCIHTELTVLAAALKFVRLEAHALAGKYGVTKTK